MNKNVGNRLPWNIHHPNTHTTLSPSTMAALLVLPNELILCIYANCPTLYTAASLATADKRLYCVWRENADHIAEAILRPQILAYEAAVEFAILEETCANGNPQLLPAKSRPPIQFYCKRLLQNADSAANTATWIGADINRAYEGGWRVDRAPASVHASYYFLRKILLGREFSDPGLHDSICLAIRAASEEEICVHEEVSNFLRSDAAYYNTVMHGKIEVRKLLLRGERVSEDFLDSGMRTYVKIKEWEYIRDFLSSGRAHE